MASSFLCPEVAHALVAHTWAIERNALRILLSGDYEPKPRAANAGPATNGDGVIARGGTAIVPIRGLITAHAKALFEDMGWATSGATLVRKVQQAIEDPDTTSVVLDVDSPGGMVAGTAEAAKELKQLRDGSSKPIVAVSNYLSASAAYWLAASAAHELIASPTSLTGSVGVIAIHEDASGAYEQEGVKYEFITGGDFKAEGNDTEPLSSEGRAFMQSQVDAFYGMFLKALAEARGTTVATITEQYGQGRAFHASLALSSGMVDRVASLGETIARLQSPQSRAAVKRRAAAAADEVEGDGTGELLPESDGETERESEPLAEPSAQNTGIELAALLDAAVEESNV